jgi:exodeoxyribonuclease V alpha subunit
MSVVRAPSGVEILQPWIDAGALGPAEVHTAAVIAELVEVEPAADDVVLAIALAVWAPQHGHACIDLDTIAADVDAELAIAAADGDVGATGRPQLPWPEPDRWHAAVSTSAAVRVVTAVDIETILDERPAVLFGRRVYTQRQWADECVVAVEVTRRSTGQCESTIRPSVLERRLPPLVDGADRDRRWAGNRKDAHRGGLAGGRGRRWEIGAHRSRRADWEGGEPAVGGNRRYGGAGVGER